MIDLSKGLSLFISNDNQSSNTLNSLISFLSDEYTILCTSFGQDKFGQSAIAKSIHINLNNYQEKINENLFRVDILVVHLSYHLPNYQEFFIYLQNLNKITFIITPKIKLEKILDNCGSYIRNFYEVKDNPEYWNSGLKRFSKPQELLEMPDKYLIKNINTDEEFTISQYKKSYIRDKKIDIFLNNNDENFDL